MNEFADYIDWVVEQGPLNTVYPDPELKKFFFEEFVGGIAKRIRNIKQLPDQYLPIVSRLVLSLGELFGLEVERDNTDMADAIRYLFEQNCALHQNLFQSEESTILKAFHDPQLAQRLPEEEKSWRLSLKAGSRLDAVKRDNEHNLNTWGKATVVNVEEELIQVIFDNDSLSNSYYFWWYSPELDRYDTQSKDEDWRQDLNVGDIIDSHDGSKVWYASTIISKEVVHETDDNSYTKLLVGFRIFDPAGEKIDNIGRRYIGWPTTFDEWINASSPRIQKFQSHAKNFEESKALLGRQLEETFEDKLDMLLYSKVPNKPVYGVIRNKCRSGLLVTFLNRLGQQGVFQKILDHIKKENYDQLSNETVFFYIDSITNCYLMFNKVFVNDYFPAFYQAVSKKILNSSEASLKNFRKDRIDSLVQYVFNILLTRIMPYQLREQEKNIFTLDIGCYFLKLNFLEKRIDGAKMISEVCKASTQMTFQASIDAKENSSDKLHTNHFIKKVVEKLKHEKVLLQMFSKERAHQQLVERGEEVLKLLIQQDAMTSEDLELVWSATKLDETTKLELYKLFNELSSILKIKEIVFIVDYLSQVPLAKIICEQVDLVYEIGKRARSGESEYGQKVIDYMWRLALPSIEQVDKVLVNKASVAITDIIRTWDNSHKINIVKRLIVSLKQNQEGFLCIKMISKIFRDFVGQYSKKNEISPEQIREDSMEIDQSNDIGNNIDNKSKFIQYMDEEMDLMLHFFFNFKHYMLKARQSLRLRLSLDNTTDHKQYADKVLADRFSHSDQMNERFEFLKFISVNSAVKISKLHLSILWKELVELQMFQDDSNQFYRFIRDVCDMYDSGIIIVELNDIIEFFEENVFRSDGEDTVFSRLTLEGFNSVSSFFLLLNQKNFKIVRLLPQNPESTVQTYPQKMTSYSNSSGASYQNFSFNNKSKDSDEDPGFHILVAPWQLDGIETIWKIVISSTSHGLTAKATTFLIKLYTSVTFSLESRISEFEDAYIDQCIKGINAMKEIIQQRKQKPKEEFENIEKPIIPMSTITKTVRQRVQPAEESNILKYLALIKELIFNSEKNGTRGVRSHKGILKGTYLDCLQIGNSLKTGQKYESKFETGVQSNITLFELKQILGKRVSRVYNKDNSGTFIQEKPCHPYSVRIYRYSGCMYFQDTDNGKTLRELKFKRNEQLTLYKNNVFNSSRVSLLNLDKTDLSDHAKYLFKEWFYKFSVRVDPKDPTSREVLDRDAVKHFISICTDTQEVKDTDEQLISMFRDYDPNEDGLVEEQEFMSFWRKSVLDCEQLVWQNIFNFGHRYDLLPQALDGEDPELYQQRKTIYDMPRYKLSCKADYFEQFFSLVETMNSEVSNSAWSLIKTIATNASLYRKVVALDRDPDFNWDHIFDLSSINKMLYVLQIVEALIEEQSSIHDQKAKDTPADMTEEDLFKRDWFERFMSRGGFQQILKMFHKSLEILASKSADHMNKFEKNFIEQMLRLIKIFVIAAFSSGEEDEGVIEVLEMVRTKSKQDEANSPAKEDKEEFKTPAKQVKGKFVQKLHDKRVQFSNNDIEQTEITTQFLFGDQDVTQPNNQEAQQEQLAQSQQLSSPDDSKKQFRALATIMHQSGQSLDILGKIDFQDLQHQILELICLILGKQELAEDDTLIIEHALSLWLATLIKNGHLINTFYNYNRPHINKMFTVKNVEDFIVTGLFTYKSIKVRQDFATTIKCICQKVVNPSGVKPVIFFLNVLRRNYPSQEHAFMWRECKFYFETLTTLIQECYNQSPKESDLEIDIYEILEEAIQKWKLHVASEIKGTVIEDKTLVGFFSMIQQTLQIIFKQGVNKMRIEEVVKSTGILEELFYGHLFFDPNSLEQTESKSKTKESRSAAYSLLLQCIKVLEPHLLADFLEDKVWNLIKDLKRPKDWKFMPSENAKSVMTSQQNYVGLVNLGCICYMNSMMQQFFMVPQFRYQLLKAIDESPNDFKEYKGYVVNDNLLKQLQIMFANLELSERQAFYPLGFCFAFKDFDGNPTNTAIQQDAQEFLNIFFARLEELLKPTTQKHLLDSVFGGKVCSQLKCPECGNIRNKLETFYTLSVAVRDRKGLMDSLEKMIESSIINDFKCENCQKKVDVEKRQLIAEPPNVLIVHLQRIQFNFDTFQNEKINSHFDFPTVLNLSDYSFKKVMSEEGHPAELLEHADVKHLSEIKDDEYVYKLVGVTIHRGTAEHGHYYSLINTKRGKDEADEAKHEWYLTEKDPWKVFDDETVRYFNFNDLKSEAFGGNSGSGNGIKDQDLSAYYMSSGTVNSYGQNAYMLVYEKMKKNPIKEVIVPEKVVEVEVEMEESDQSASGPSSEQKNSEMQVDEGCVREIATLESIDTANSRANVTSAKSTLATSATALADAPHPDYQVDPENGEKYKLISFKKINQFVPDWIKSSILQDNQMFLIDRHIYHEQFFNFIRDTLKHIANHSVMTQHLYKLDYMQQFHKLKRVAFSIAQKVLLDMQAYYMNNSQMSDITASMQTILTFSDSPYTFFRGDPSILHQVLKTSYMEDDCQHLMTIMFLCTDKTSRFYIGKFTTIVINKIYQIYSDTAKKENGIPDSLELLKQDADKILCKLIKALKTPECVKNWQKIDQYLQMIHSILVDGPIQQEVALQNFEIVPYLLDFLLANVNLKTSSKLSTFDPIVSLICQFTRFSLTPTMRLENMFWVEDTEEGIKVPATLLGFDLNTMRDMPERYPLKDESFDYILSSEFVEMCLKEGVQCIELGKMIAHLCYKFEKFSKRISKLLLHGISRGDFEKVKSYLDVVTQLAIIKDDYQQSRLEWLFGVGILNSITSQTSKTNDPNEVLTKVGIPTLHSMSDEAYQFKSALIQDSIDDSLLHLLWRYKGRMDDYTVNCLYGLLNLISLDEYVAIFFSKLPSPTYCYARYTDWFLPYLEKQLLNAQKGYSGSSSGERQETVVKCISLYEKYSAMIGKAKKSIKTEDVFTVQYKPIPDMPRNEDVVMCIEYDDESEENIKNLISLQSIQRGESSRIVAKFNEDQTTDLIDVFRTDPQPYIITACLNEKLVSNVDYGLVQLHIYSLGCSYTESLPTGETNLAIPKGVFRKNWNNNPSNKHQKNEREMQTHFMNNYFQSAGLASKVEDSSSGRRNGILVSKEQDQWDEKDEEHRVNDDYEDNAPKRMIIKDTDDQWEMINNKDNDSDKASFNSSENKDRGEMDVQEQIDRYNIENQDDATNQVYKIQVVEEGGDDMNHQPANNTPTNQQYGGDPTFVTESNHIQQRFEDKQENFNQDMQENNQNEEQVQIVWPNDVHYCEDLAYRIEVVNQRDATIKCSILFREIADICEISPLNLVYPKGGFKAVIQPHSNKTVIILHKLRATKTDEEGDILEIQKIITEFKFSEKYLRAGGNHGNSNQAVPPISLPLRNRNASANIQAQSRTGASTGEAIPLIKKNKVNKEIDDDDGIPEIDDYAVNDQSSDGNSNTAVHPDPNYFDPDMAYNPSDPVQQSGFNDEIADSVNPLHFNEDLDKRKCPACTFDNQLDSAFCEMCFSELK